MLKEYTVAEGVLAFSTMRKGGVSLGNYSEFNINEYCGDSSEHIWENRRLLAERLGVSADHIVMPHQVHGIEVPGVAVSNITRFEQKGLISLKNLIGIAIALDFHRT